MTKTLLDMPDVAITEIMSYLDYMSIQNTRKTCWKLRNFLEAVQFDPRIRSISFYEREDRIIATMSTEKVWNDMEGRVMRLQYKANEDGCEVTWQPTRHEQKVKVVKNEHYSDVFWRDLKILLANVRTTLRSFSVTTHNSIHQNVFATKLEKILKLRREAIQVETISIDAFNPTEVAQILQCFDSKTLNWLVINNTQSIDDVMDISEIVRLDHWKQAKHITMDSWRFPSVQMKHFAHFQICDIHSTNFIAHKIKIVKEMFLQSTEYEKTANFNTAILQQKDKILQALGRNTDLLEDTTDLYKAANGNTTSVYQKQERTIDGINFMKAFHSDLEMLLKNQKHVSEPMSLGIQIDGHEKLNQNRVNEETMNRLIETFLTELKQVLTSRAEIFLIDSLLIDVLDQKHVMLVLPFLYPERLETLWLSNAYKNHDDRTLEMNVFVQTEHWKNIEEFYVEGLVVNASVRNFAHISRLKT